MKLIVGCPVARRSWVLPTWFHYVRQALTASVGAEVGFVFVVHPQDPSWATIREYAPEATLVEAPFARGGDVRDWRPERYRQMVELRNLLLGAVRDQAPDVFLSLDSDILLHANQLTLMFETLQGYDAVGGRCYMTTAGTRFPSWGRLYNGMLQRYDATGTFQVDVIMAIKLMSPAAYHVDYIFDLQGEDVGWSRNAVSAGLRLGWDGRVAAKHVLAPHLLTARDARVGF